MSNPSSAPTLPILAHKSYPAVDVSVPRQGGPGMTQGNLAAVQGAPGLVEQERLELEELREKKRWRQEQGKVHSKT